MALNKDKITRKFSEAVHDLHRDLGVTPSTCSGTHGAERVKLTDHGQDPTQLSRIEVWSPIGASAAADRVLADLFWMCVPTGRLGQFYNQAKDTLAQTGAYQETFGEVTVFLQKDTDNYHLIAKV